MNRKQRRKENAMKKRLKPGLHSLTVLHDDWCNFYNGQGECNCNPEYKMVSYEDSPKQFIKNQITTAEIFEKQNWWDGNE